MIVNCGVPSNQTCNDELLDCGAVLKPGAIDDANTVTARSKGRMT
jgi:hypothetical protein